jgi:uncharacterized alkaline shock family protein YloU
MIDSKLKVDKKKVDTKEFELPETMFIRDIENKVFQSIVLQCLAQIEGISLVEGNFIDHLLGRSSEGVKGIYAEQDDKNQSVNIKVEVNILYGTSIPEKAEEIQTKIAEEITKLTGLHVASVHVVFKNVISIEQANKLNQQNPNQGPPHLMGSNLGEEYSDEF